MSISDQRESPASVRQGSFALRLPERVSPLPPSPCPIPPHSIGSRKGVLTSDDLAVPVPRAGAKAKPKTLEHTPWSQNRTWQFLLIFLLIRLGAIRILRIYNPIAR